MSNFKTFEKIEDAIFGLKELELDAEDCRTLQHHYANVQGDILLLMELAKTYKLTIAEVYYECKKANKMLGERQVKLSQEAANKK